MQDDIIKNIEEDIREEVIGKPKGGVIGQFNSRKASTSASKGSLKPQINTKGNIAMEQASAGLDIFARLT